MDTITGTILGGTIVMSILLYTVMILQLSIMALRGNMKSDSKGIKHLRFQEWNHIWNKYVIR